MRNYPAKPRVAAAGLLAATSFAMADAPLRPPAEITRCSQNGLHCAIADPRTDTLSVYRMRVSTREGTIWSVKGWQRDFYLANGGEDLVACYSGLNLLPLDYDPDWAMLTFYHHGKVVRQVPLRDLILDRRKLQRTVSHYSWGGCRGFGRDGSFEVETVDRGLLRFDVRTGLVEKEP